MNINLKFVNMEKFESLSGEELENTNGGWMIGVGVALFVIAEWDCLAAGYNEARA